MVISMQKWRAKRSPLHPLSETDWRVIEMARSDGPRSFNPDGWAASLLRILGVSVAHGLANDSLEALRRFSVRAWYWDLIRSSDIRRLFGAGYSNTHVRQILAHVASLRGFTPASEEELA
jgi:hypothetical protein